MKLSIESTDNETMDFVLNKMANSNDIKDIKKSLYTMAKLTNAGTVTYDMGYHDGKHIRFGINMDKTPENEKDKDALAPTPRVDNK